MMANPVTFSHASTAVRRLPPNLGEHSHEILIELGFNDEQITDIMKFDD